MLTFTRVLVVTVLFLMLSCQPSERKPAIENALSTLCQRFPQLSHHTTGKETYFKLVRSVRISETGIELQLRSSPDSATNPQSIILLINAQNEVQGIPWLSNQYRDYWGFEYDTNLSTVPPTTTTFQKECERSLQSLGLVDTLGTALTVMDELFISLLQCRRIEDSDSLAVQAATLKADFEQPEEVQDSCGQRLKKSWQAIQREMHPSDVFTIQNAYWDKRNHRIYQLGVDRGRRFLKKDGLKVYRQDCVFHPISL